MVLSLRSGVDGQLKTQSARGDNQNPNRPSSSYGPSSAQPPVGPSGANVGPPGGVPNPVPSSAYQTQPEGSTNNLMAAQLENAEQDTNPFGNVYPPANPHNGSNADPY